LAAAWSIALAVFGGIDLRAGGIVLTSNEPVRPLVAAAVLLAIFVLAGGRIAQPARLLRAMRGSHAMTGSRRLVGPNGLAWGLTATVVVVGWIYGCKAVVGADSYGYLSQSDLWQQGSLKIRQPFAAEVPWPDAGWMFSPIGSYRPMHLYRRVEGEDRWTIVPLYPIGLPILLAGAGTIAGYQAKFMVVPLLAGLAVIATYGIGVRLVSPTAGLIGAWLVATSPAFVFMTMPVMSDVPVTALVAAAFYLLIGPGVARAGGAGAVISLAVLVRPVLAPLVGVMGLWYLVRFMDREDRDRTIRAAAAFAVCGLPAAILFALTNSHLYGSVTTTGYGALDTRFSLEYVPQNLSNYVRWFAETQTPAAFLGIVAVMLPIRRFWPEPASRRAASLSGLCVLVVWGLYFVYEAWDVWWYLRFLLPSYPFIFVGVGAVGAALVRGRGRAARAALWAVVVTWGAFQIWTASDRRAFEIWRDDRRAVPVAEMTRTVTPRDSLILAGEHTGSVRYYGGRMTGYYFFLKGDWVDRGVEWLKTQNIHPYLLLEEWEVAEVRIRFAGQEAAKALDRAPVAIFRDPGTVYLFDLLRGDGDPALPPTIWTDVDRGLWAAPRAQPPPVMLGRLRGAR
jgi:hypothetical protein